MIYDSLDFFPIDRRGHIYVRGLRFDFDFEHEASATLQEAFKKMAIAVLLWLAALVISTEYLLIFYVRL